MPRPEPEYASIHILCNCTNAITSIGSNTVNAATTLTTLMVLNGQGLVFNSRLLQSHSTITTIYVDVEIICQ